MLPHDYAKLLSNGLSVTLIILCCVVLLLFGRSTAQALKDKSRLDAQGWFVIGVFFTHLADAGDNSYWLFPWTLSFLHDPDSLFYVELGVYPNILIRLLLGGFGVYCHIRSALMHRNHPDNTANKILSLAITAGFTYSLFLLFWVN